MSLLRYLLGLSLLFTTVAYGATWVEIYRDSEVTVSYDKDTVKIKRLGNGQKYLEVWEKRSYSKPKVYNTTWTGYGIMEDTYVESVVKKYFDCTNDKYGITQSVYYYTNNRVPKSNSYSVSTNNSTTWDDVVPDSIGEVINEALCSTYRNQLR